MDFRFSSRSEASGEWQMFAATDPNVKRGEPMALTELGLWWSRHDRSL